jgi:hypothetical protein
MSSDIIKFQWEKLNETKVENFWNSSEDATAFTRYYVLSGLSHRSDWWGVYKGNELIAIWPVPLSKTDFVYIPEFCYYVGPIWSKSHSLRPESSKFSERLSVYNFSINELLSVYSNLVFELSPSQLDVRPFLWWNHQTQNSVFKVEPRYSAVISGIQVKTNTEILAGFRELRRREVKKVSIIPKLEILSVFPFEKISDLYWRVLGLQNITRNHEVDESLMRIVKLAEKSDLKFFVFTNPDSSELLGIIVLLLSKKTANLVLNLTEPSARNTGLSSWAMYQVLTICKSLGVDSFDFNGANSPNRGDDKHSYGAKESLYFRLSYK